MDFSTKFNDKLAAINEAIERFVPPSPATEPAGAARINETMRYSLQAGGKRIRPMLLLSAFDVFSPKARQAAAPLPCAVAIECVHTYSLIHDDLPCMDNDDLRRGRPTAHKQFDEATALLAGDALLTHAFVLLSENYDGNLSRELTRTLSQASSAQQLIGGQMHDILSEKNADATAADLNYIHLNKTAALLEASLVCGGLLGQAAEGEIEKLRQIGRQLGLTFQIIDDILDATTDTKTLGKTAGKDAAVGKTTHVKLHGLENSRQAAAAQTTAAIAAIKSLDGDSSFLEYLARMLLERKK